MNHTDILAAWEIFFSRWQLANPEYQKMSEQQRDYIAYSMLDSFKAGINFR